MKPILSLFGKNLAMTLSSVVLWLIVGYFFGSMAAAAREPVAATFLSRGGSIDTATLARYRDTRDATIEFCAWCGMLTAQAVFLAHHFGAGQDVRAGGFPVKEL